MSHHYRRLQRRVIIGTTAVALIVVLVGTVLIFRPELRLHVAYRLGLAPGADATRVYGEDAPVELLVLVETVPVELSLAIKRYHAVAIAERTGGQIRLHYLNDDRVIEVPLKDYDRVAAADDRSALLFVEEDAPSGVQAVLVTLHTGEVRRLPPGQIDPGIPGNWTGDIAGAYIDCNGVSPAGTWVACIDQRPGASRYLFGNWELQVHPFGRSDEVYQLYRGLGFLPVVGWTEDERWIYLQNETGIWRVAAPGL